jgi:hypothetical protein
VGALSLLLPASPLHSRAGRARMCSSDRGDNDLERELRDRVTGGCAGARFGEAHVLLESRVSAFVLLFNPGQADEGVYTLQSKTMAQETCLVAFEESDSAERFSHLLSAEGFDMAHPTEWSAEQIRFFCDASEFGLGFVSAEALLLPPRNNVFDHEAFDQLREEQVAPQQEPPEEDPLIVMARQRLERAWEQGS